MATLVDQLTMLHKTYYVDPHMKEIKKNAGALRLGVLSAANISPLSIFSPVSVHPDVVLEAIAARESPSSLSKAREYANAYGIKRVLEGYQALVDDPNVDVVYNPLPNSGHAEWTIKCIQKGKHVLLEKPAGNNAEEVEAIFAAAKAKGVVVLEAFHSFFHPASLAIKEMIDSGRYGKPVSAWASMSVPTGAVPKDNIRWAYPLGGGCLMDSTYVIAALRLWLGTDPLRVSSAKADIWPHDGSGKVDARMNARLEFPGDVKAEIWADHDRQKIAGIVSRKYEVPCAQVETEDAIIYIYNYMFAHVYHYISIQDKKSGKTRYEKHYVPAGGKGKGESWWTTYRYQLEVFVDLVRGRTPESNYTPTSSIAQARALDMTYLASGLPLRPTSDYVKSFIATKK